MSEKEGCMVCPGCGELVDGYDIDHLTGKIYHTVTKTVVAADRKSLRTHPIQKEECLGKGM